MWQKALHRGIKGTGCCWVVSCAPVEAYDLYDQGDNRRPISPCFATNIVGFKGNSLVWIESVKVELLPEFADNVPLLDIEEFLKGLA